MGTRKVSVNKNRIGNSQDCGDFGGEVCIEILVVPPFESLDMEQAAFYV
jgi:hypothetical protein